MNAISGMIFDYFKKAVHLINERTGQGASRAFLKGFDPSNRGNNEIDLGNGEGVTWDEIYTYFIDNILPSEYIDIIPDVINRTITIKLKLDETNEVILRNIIGSEYIEIDHGSLETNGDIKIVLDLESLTQNISNTIVINNSEESSTVNTYSAEYIDQLIQSINETIQNINGAIQNISNTIVGISNSIQNINTSIETINNFNADVSNSTLTLTRNGNPLAPTYNPSSGQPQTIEIPGGGGGLSGSTDLGNTDMNTVTQTGFYRVAGGSQSANHYPINSITSWNLAVFAGGNGVIQVANYYGGGSNTPKWRMWWRVGHDSNSALPQGTISWESTSSPYGWKEFTSGSQVNPGDGILTIKLGTQIIGTFTANQATNTDTIIDLSSIDLGGSGGGEGSLANLNQDVNLTQQNTVAQVDASIRFITVRGNVNSPVLYVNTPLNTYRDLFIINLQNQNLQVYFSDGSSTTVQTNIGGGSVQNPKYKHFVTGLGKVTMNPTEMTMG